MSVYCNRYYISFLMQPKHISLYRSLVIENYEIKDDGIVDEASAYLKLLEQKK